MVHVNHLAELADTIVRAARRIQALDMPEGVVKLSNLETIVMNRIDDRPGITSKQLGEQLSLKSSNTSTALRELEEKGFVERRPDPSDGRGTCIYPSEFARENLRRVHEHLGMSLDKILNRSDTVDDRELDAALAVLRVLNDGLEQAPGSPEPGR